MRGHIESLLKKKTLRRIDLINTRKMDLPAIEKPTAIWKSVFASDMSLRLKRADLGPDQSSPGIIAWVKRRTFSGGRTECHRAGKGEVY